MAKKEAVTFTRRVANVLNQMASNVSGGSSAMDPRVKPGNSVGLWIMKATTTISPADFSCVNEGGAPVPGSGTAVICYRDKTTGQLIAHEPNGNPVSGEVFSLLTEAIPAGWYFTAYRDLAGTLWTDRAFAKCDGGSGPGGGSGGGSGPGSGSGCIDVVTDVSFDPYTCKLIVCTRNICFPPGTIIGPEDCGSGSGGN